MASLAANLSTSDWLVKNENVSCETSVQGNQSGPTMDSYPLRQPFGAAVFGVVSVAIALLCICGNALVLFVVSRSTPMYPRTTYVFLSNLAAADLLVGVFCVIPYMYQAMFFTWELPHPLCKVWKFVETTSITVSILLLQVIALERFIAISYPLQAKRLFTNRKIRFAQVLVWLTACLYGAPMLIVWNAHVVSLPSSNEAYCIIVPKYHPIIKAYSLINFIMWYLLPLMFMTILYCKIGLTLRQSQLLDHSMNLRHRCPVDSREASVEHVTDGSSSGAAARQGPSDGNTGSTSHARRVQAPSSSRTVKSRLQLWWKKKKMKNPVTATTIVKQSCCSKPSRRSVNKGTSGNKDTQESEENQETSFTVHSASPNRVPRTFSFQGKRGGGDRRGVLGCLEPEISSQGAPGSGENQGNLEGVPTGRRLSHDRRRTSESENSQAICRVTSAIPRCRLTTQYSSRRRAIRLLVVVVVSFAVLLFPIHFRKLLPYLKIKMDPFGISAYLVLISHLCLYMNSAINPILYTFVSQTFRRHLREAFCSCRSRTSRCIRFRRANKPEVSSLPNTRNSYC